MIKLSLFTLLGILFLVPANAATADWHSFWNGVHLDWHRNNCWPVPFQEIDRRTVCQTMSVQIANGWRRQNTISDVYFDADTQTLNEAGRRKLYAILTQTPETYRAIYVVEAVGRDAQQRRIDSIQSVTAELQQEQPTPEIISVKIPPRSWSAEYIDAIDRKVQSSLPAPVLPEFIDTTN